MLTVDRFEGAYAICERLDGRFVQIPISAIRPPVSEGDVLRLFENGLLFRDEAATARKKAQAEALLSGLFSS